MNRYARSLEALPALRQKKWMLKDILSWLTGKSLRGARPEVTVERLRQMLAYAQMHRRTGQGGIDGFPDLGYQIAFQAEPRDIDFRRAHGAYRRDEIVHSPAHIMWGWKPKFAFVGLVNGAVEYRFSTDSEAAWWGCPPTHDPAHIQQISLMFDAWYDHLGLPASIEDALAPRDRESLDRSDKMALIHRYLENCDPAYLHDVMGAPDENDIIVWVDWREDEVDIIRMFEAVLRTGDLSARYLPNDVSADLEITYRGKTFVTWYPGGIADRDITLLALDAALSPEFAIRYCSDSEGSDTAALLPLSGAQWVDLEAAAPGAVEKLFRPLSPDRPVFA